MVCKNVVYFNGFDEKFHIKELLNIYVICKHFLFFFFLFEASKKSPRLFRLLLCGRESRWARWDIIVFFFFFFPLFDFNYETFKLIYECVIYKFNAVIFDNYYRLLQVIKYVLQVILWVKFLNKLTKEVLGNSIEYFEKDES